MKEAASFLLRLPVFAAFCLVAACGGSGDNSGPPPAPPPPPNPNPGPTLTLTANPLSVSPGQTSTITWASSNTTGCTASGGWSGARAVSGSEQVGPLNATTTFSMSCVGTAGSANQSVTVGVTTPSAPVTISGTVRFQLPPFAAASGGGLNLNNPVELPARGIVVEAINPSTRARIASSVTDANGLYSVAVPQNTQMLISARAEMVMTGAAPSWTFQVLNNTNGNALYVLDGSSFNSGTADATRNLLATTGWNGTTYSATRAAAPFAILDAVHQSRDLILSAVPTTAFPALSLYWSPSNRPTQAAFCTPNGDIGTTFYTTGAPALVAGNCVPSVALPAGIYILGDYAGGSGDTDEFDQHVIAHEFGHYVEDKFSRSDSIGGSHARGDRLDLRLAFGEGWGNAYSGMSLDDPRYRDSFNGVSNDFGFNLETDNTTAEGWFSESSVDEILWDLFDATNDGPDQISLGFAPIYSVMTGAQRTTDALTSIYSFIDALRSNNSGQAAAIDALLTGESIRSTDAFADGETNAGNSQTALPVYTDISVNSQVNVCSSGLEDDSNKLGARRFLRLSLSTGTVLTIAASGAVGPGSPPNSQPASDPDIYIYNQGVLVASGTASTNTPGSSETITQRAIPAGTNIIEVHDWIGAAVPRCMTVAITGP